MSKADSIQNKIWKAYGKVGKLLGKDFSIYRPTSLDSPLTSDNWIATVTVAFSQDTNFSAPLELLVRWSLTRCCSVQHSTR